MHKAFLLVSSVGLVLALFLSPSRGDVEPIDELADDTEPIIGDPIEPLPGFEEIPSEDQPWEPDPAMVWSYEMLTAGERAVIDRGLADDQAIVQAAYAAASADLAEQAMADRAALQLGIEEPLDQIGVVP